MSTVLPTNVLFLGHLSATASPSQLQLPWRIPCLAKHLGLSDGDVEKGSSNPLGFVPAGPPCAPKCLSSAGWAQKTEADIQSGPKEVTTPNTGPQSLPFDRFIAKLQDTPHKWVMAWPSPKFATRLFVSLRTWGVGTYL